MRLHALTGEPMPPTQRSSGVLALVAGHHPESVRKGWA